MGIHDGHRNRLKEQFMNHGLDSFSDHVVLELLLFYALPRRDTNELAHTLLNHFGSLDAVFEAAPEELQKIPGIGDHAATLLHLIPQVNRRYLIAKHKTQSGPALDTDEKAGQFAVAQLYYEKEEVQLAVCLDSYYRIISSRFMSRGTVNAVEISTRRLVQYALKNDATAVLIAHNHPCGVALPSQEDIIVTQHILNALTAVSIELYDHIIVAGDEYISLYKSGMI